ncbi:MAG: DUF445 domain-containing protein [Oligoflexia bacterium]|nr:DUF445 domain-containing protein [Oligoflexia bacterium]
MKQSLATGLLLLVALLLGLVITLEPFSPEFTHWTKVFLQAALVGALADWFAVVALFRHPLGLPIPHTALIPSNRDRIATALGSFVQTNFLSPEVLADKVLALRVGEEAAAWLAKGDNQKRLVRLLVPAYRGFLGTFDDPALRSALARATGAALRNVDAPFALARAIELSIVGHANGEVGDAFLRWLEALLNQHETYLREALRHEMPWYVPNFIHDKVYRDVIRKIRQSLAAANTDPNHQLRTNLSISAQKFAQELRIDSTIRQSIQGRWLSVLGSPVVGEYVERLLGDIRLALQRDFETSPHGLERILGAWILVLATILSESKEVRDGVSDLAARSAQGIATHYRVELANLVTETVRRWDARTMVEKIESQVGEDLQYIRINGTLVGGLVGVLLELLVQHAH